MVHGTRDAGVDRHLEALEILEEPDPCRHLEVGAVWVDQVQVRVIGAEEVPCAPQDGVEQLLRRAAIQEHARRLVERSHEGIAGVQPQARPLGDVERGIGRLDQGVLGEPVVRVAGNPDADRYARPVARRPEGSDGSADAFRDVAGTSPARVGEQDRELVAAVPIDAVTATRGRLDRSRDIPEQLVARRVAKGVVVDLEAVQVHHQDGEGPAFGGLDLRSQLALERAVIEEAGQGVVLGLDLDDAVRLRVAEGDRGLRGKQLRQLEFILGEVRLRVADARHVEGTEHLALDDQRNHDQRFGLQRRARDLDRARVGDGVVGENGLMVIDRPARDAAPEWRVVAEDHLGEPVAGDDGASHPTLDIHPIDRQ